MPRRQKGVISETPTPGGARAGGLAPTETVWEVKVGPGGWATVSQHVIASAVSSVERVLVRVEPDDAGRYRVQELHLFSAGMPVTAERLRAIRVSAIEQVLNLPEERAAIQREYTRGGTPNLETFAERFTAPREQMRTGALAPKGPVSGTSASALRAPGRSYPDDFYERVAAEYRNAFRRGARPVAAIAVAAQVPRSTAARWVKEARRRELLGAAAAPGKAGDQPSTKES